MLERIKEKLNKPKSLFMGEETAMRSAVLIPLVEKDGEWHVLFEVRSQNMRKQPGDCSFPGGRIDEGETPRDAAIRETCEELGVKITAIELMDDLSPYVMSPNFIVYPFVGVIHDIESLQPNADEVEEVFTVPLSWLMTHEPELHTISLQPIMKDDFPFDKIQNGKNYKWRAGVVEEYFFEYDNYVIWGLTARMLKYFITRLK